MVIPVFIKMCLSLKGLIQMRVVAITLSVLRYIIEVIEIGWALPYLGEHTSTFSPQNPFTPTVHMGMYVCDNYDQLHPHHYSLVC